jgi:hypothetical protein
MLGLHALVIFAFAMKPSQMFFIEASAVVD